MSIRAFCILSAILLAAASATGHAATARLLQFADLEYVGGFRLPAASTGGADFSFGGRPLAHNPAANSLFVGTRGSKVAEVSIPEPTKSPVVTQLPTAAYLQPFADPTEGNLAQIASSDTAIDGLLVFGDRLYGTGLIYYDANNVQAVSHYSRSLSLSEPSFKGMYRVWEKGKTGFVSGYMATVPPEWQLRLGGPAITGQCCIPIVTRTSWGPSAFAWNPAHLGVAAPLPTLPLLYYTGDHATLGPWAGANPTYGATTQLAGVALIAGTGTALFVGRNGTGPFCYGNGTSDRTLVGSRGPDRESYCYDPTSSDKGQHAYPYVYQFWAYDLNDFAAVKAGRKKPWELIPYGVWPFTLPTSAPAVQIGGVAYDPLRQRLYISQLQADQDDSAYRPVIHVFHIP